MTKQLHPLPSSAAVIDELGNLAVRRLTGKAPSTISTWKTRGFPNDVDLYLTINAELKPKGYSAPASLFGIANEVAA
jgi:hypothetical protein